MSKNITFEQLKTELVARAGQPEMLPRAQIGNGQSALRAFCLERGFAETDRVGESLRGERCQRLLAEHMAATGANRNRRWLLNIAAHLVTVLDYESAVAANAPTPICSALRAVFADRALRISPTAKAIGVTPRTLSLWVAGTTIPGPNMTPALSRLEQFAGRTPGSLTGCLPSRYRPSKPSPVEAASEEDGESEEAVDEKPYTLPLQVIEDELPHLKAQIEAMILQKTLGASAGPAVSIKWTPEMMARRKAATKAELAYPWRLRELRDGEAPRWWDCVGSNYSPTGTSRVRQIRMFLGWANMPIDSGGAGLPLKSLSLTLLADAELVDRYFTWQVAENGGGAVTCGAIKFLVDLKPLLTQDSGHITRTWSLGESVGIVDEAAWKARCAATRASILALISKFRGEVPASSRQEKVLAEVLKLERPLDAFIRGVHRLERDYSAYKGNDAPLRERDLLLLTLLMSNPLRVLNFSTMLLTDLRKEPDGSWRIFIHRSRLKNQNGAAKDKDYDQPVEPGVWPYIEAYLAVRAQFVESRYLFAPQKHDESAKGQFLGTATLTERLKTLTQRYIPELPMGTRAHGFRHIRATHEIITTGDYMHAAYLLHDKVETVQKYYALVLNAYHERQRALRGTTSALSGLSGRAARPPTAPSISA